ncbi:MAG: hypothetical protein FWD23_06595 [Oscillospiraceae bacterium]|nr:hypothetical protein [Oscillospiraceae bacterium]
MKKLPAAFILAPMIIVLLFGLSCSKTDGSIPANDNAVTNADLADVPGETIPSNQRQSVKDGLPDGLDFGGMDFNMFYVYWSMYPSYYFVEEEIGEAFNDAIYRRQKNVEERLNVKFNYVSQGSTNSANVVSEELRKTVLAGTDEYQLMFSHCIYGNPEAVGYLQNWNTIPYVDFARPWWNQQMNKELSVRNVLLMAVSDLIIFDPNVIFFNKGMIRDFSLENPYSLVNSGKWTWAKLAEMAKVVAKDLNGDGVRDKDDQYGFVATVGWMNRSALQGAGLTTVTKTDDGDLQLNLHGEKFGRLMDTLFDLFFDATVTYIDDWDPNTIDMAGRKFQPDINMNTNRALFITDALSVGKHYRTYDVEFGILPFPKLDEAQEKYWSLSWNGFMWIPITADPEISGAVCEALAAESYRYVVPAYYDILLTSKIARDEESREMIDIIYDGACYDFALNYGNGSPLSFSVTMLLDSKNNNHASFVEKNETSFMKSLQKAVDKIIDDYTD